MKFFLFLTVFFLFLLIVQYWQIIKVLLLNPIHKFTYQSCSPDEIPKSMRKQLKHAISLFQKLGFKTVHFQKHNEIYFALKKPVYSAVLWHPEHNIYVDVENNMAPDAIQPFKSTLLSFYESTKVVGYYAEAYGVIDGYEGNHCIDNTHQDINIRLKSFLEYLSEYENDNELGSRLKQSTKTYINRLNTSASEYIDYLEQQEIVKRTNEGAYAFTFVSAIKMASQLRKGAAAVAKKESEHKALLNQHPDYLLAPEVNAYYRLDKIINHNTFNKWIKTILLILSVMAFAVLFGSFLSYSFVVLLIPVLFFHELGHYAAMRLFGYHDLQILFLPFGAAVLGKEKDVSVLKKVIVSLAGPVPGIIVALFIGWISPESLEIDWINQLVIVLLIINYFNLLPFMPLDGGQIINQVLLGRYPIAQFVFSVLSVAAFAFFAFYFDDFIVKTIAIFLGLGLIGQFNNTKLLYGLKNITFSNKTELIAKIFKSLEKEPIRFQQKFQKIQAILPFLEQSKAKFYEIILGLILYFTALFAPLYALNTHTNGAFMTVIKSQIGQDDYPVPDQYTLDYWQNKVNESSDNDEKFNVYIELMNFMESDDLFYEFEPLIKQGLSFAKLNNFDEHPDYPILLKANVLLPYWLSGDNSAIDSTLLNELEQREHGQNIQYAHALLDIYSYHYEPPALEKLMIAQKIFENKNKAEYINQTRISLIDYYENAKEFEKAESLLTELSKDDEFFDFNMFAHHYFKRQQFDKAFEFSKKQIDQYESDDDIILEMDLNSCAWFALFAKQYDASEKYFTQAYGAQKRDMVEIYNIYEEMELPETYEQLEIAYEFQHHMNLMVLYWSQNDLQKATMALHQLNSLEEKSDLIDWDIKMEMYRDQMGNNLSFSQKQASLIVKAIDDLSGK